MSPVSRPPILEPGRVTPGVWCATCALPSAFACELIHLTDTGVETTATVSYCPECDDWQRVS